ncbi:MAG: hypothetical protein CMN76_10765 [Spirochaetaceae bacterium]|nr:hypothetical protein [Spirochaetaceae bacterium]|tara:strand:- start:25445 stop:26014 length:570 start_codon:yes stop_codon:yes gene_type:complete
MKQDSANNRKRLVWAGLAIAAVFCISAILNLTSPDFPFCISESWCLSSAENPFGVAGMQTLSFMLVIVGVVLGLRWAIAMLVSPRAYLYFALFFAGLGVFGTTVFYLTGGAGKGIDYIHIPIIGGLCILLGLLFLLYFPGGLLKRKHDENQSLHEPDKMNKSDMPDESGDLDVPRSADRYEGEDRDRFR